MSKDDFVSFEDYARKLSGEDLDHRSAAEILAEAREVEKELGGDSTKNGT